jgi:putative transposase
MRPIPHGLRLTSLRKKPELGYNHLRYHESIDNLTPADVYFGRGQTILLERERIKRKTIQHRRLHHKTHAA